MQNNAEHACKSHKCMCEVSIHARARFCFVCTDLYQIFFGGPLLYDERKFHKDLIFRLRDIFKIKKVVLERI